MRVGSTFETALPRSKSLRRSKSGNGVFSFLSFGIGIEFSEVETQCVEYSWHVLGTKHGRKLGLQIFGTASAFWMFQGARITKRQCGSFRQKFLAFSKFVRVDLTLGISFLK